MLEVLAGSEFSSLVLEPEVEVQGRVAEKREFSAAGAKQKISRIIRKNSLRNISPVLISEVEGDI